MGLEKYGDKNLMRRAWMIVFALSSAFWGLVILAVIIMLYR